MWLVDELAEQHIKAALEKGELSNLPGSGKPLQLDDDSHVPPELRAGYRLLKNAGFLPPELELRREAMEVNDLIRQLDPADHHYQDHCHRLQLLALRLRQAGMSTDFLHCDYSTALQNHFSEEE
ncbi:DnaJ family domain-containing protein [Pantoea vagans]|uniref:DnaJ family domain-containing protein n=1 Tax=Pantoea vagans TaxID=470934 RepID=UPI00241F4492|nr:DnaJ family domain-containing protein [Pantoea vagans]